MRVLALLVAGLAVARAAGDDDDDASPWYFNALIPFIAGIVGYVTNWQAIKMTVGPIDFLGVPCLFFDGQPIGLFGWQGIIPAKAGKMASLAVTIMTEKLFDLKEIFSRLDPQRCSELMRPGLLQCIRESLDDVGRMHMPVAWSRLPPELKEDLERRMADQSGVLVTELMRELQEDVEQVIDIHHMVVNHFELHKELLVKMFLECGSEEFAFIIRSGFFFGFLFGILQMVVWWAVPEWYVLPIGGAIVGYFTNYLALLIIFSPVEPTNFLCCSFQGLFLLRQKEVSAIFARINAEDTLTAEFMWKEILYGQRSNRFEGLLRKYTTNFVDDVVEGVRPAVLAYIGEPQFRELRDRMCDLVVAGLPQHVSLIYEYSDRALDIETELRTKMEALPSKEFERVLHPVFEEDEIKLILVGAVLGAAAGFLQLLLLF